MAQGLGDDFDNSFSIAPESDRIRMLRRQLQPAIARIVRESIPYGNTAFEVMNPEWMKTYREIRSRKISFLSGIIARAQEVAVHDVNFSDHEDREAFAEEIIKGLAVIESHPEHPWPERSGSISGSAFIYP